MSEAAIQHAIRAAVVRTGRATLWRNSVGFDRERNVKYGLGLGSPDLVGCLFPSGRLFALEVKTPTGRVSPDQKLWHGAARKLGAFVAVVRSVDEALAALERAHNGESE